MKRGRRLLIVTLFTLPVAVLVGAGGLALLRTGWFFWLWWLLPAAWGLGYLLARQTPFAVDGAASAGARTPAYWTERDRAAWRLVEEIAREGLRRPASQLVEGDFYIRTAERLALELARFYHPGARDPISALTLPEILAAAQLALADLAELVDTFVPGSRQLTVGRWRQLALAPEWYDTVSNIGYAFSALLGPASTASRYLVSRLVLGPAFELMRHNVVLWFYGSFVHQVGLYVIEMNSGRLANGAKAWREHVGRYREALDAKEDTPPVASPARAAVTIAVIGQVNAGKSSLVNALLGERRAATDVLPLTAEVTSYELAENDLPRVILWDTAGYAGGVGLARDAERAVAVVREADLVLVVLDALNPAREADQIVLRRVAAWFMENPKYPRPPMLGVMTHIDQLSPVLEWSPPYDGWRRADSPRPKEQSIRAAVEFNRGQLEPFIVDVVPVCCDPARRYGVDDELFPEIVALLDEARGVLLVRTLHRSETGGEIIRSLRQARALGLGLLRSALHRP